MIENKKNYVYKVAIVLCLISPLFGRFEFVGLGGKRIESFRLNSNYLYAATDNGIYRKNILVSDTNWTSIGLNSYETKVLLVVNSDIIFASIKISGMGSDTVSLFKTVDGGATWIPSQNGFGGGTGYSNQVLDLDGLSYEPDTIYATGYAQVAKSIDFGMTWNLVWSDWNYSGVGTHFVKIDTQSPNIVWTGGESGFFQPYIHKSVDFGVSWQENFLEVGGDNACYSIAIDPQSSDVVYIGMEGRILKTMDGGDNWNTVFSPTKYPYFFSIEINPNYPSLIYAAGAINTPDPQELILYKSENGGTTWSFIIEGIPGQKGVLDMLLLSYENTDNLYFATNGGGVYKYTNETLSIEDSSEEQLPTSFSLNQNYPNPFNLTTTISFRLPQPAKVHLSIFSLTGQLVETLVSEHKNVGYHSVSWNANGVGSGLYFYRIEASEYTETKKCLILK